MSIVQAAHEFSTERWTETKDFVLNRPLASLIYTLAMKFFGYYCHAYFDPLGGYLCIGLFTASLIFDLAIIVQRNEYKEALHTNFEDKKADVWRRVTDFYEANVTAAARGFIGAFFESKGKKRANA